MSSCRDEGPVYYREIQKNAYLKRIPNEEPGGKLRPLGHKKPPLKPMWTLFCVHNGRTPYLEQYPEAECALTLAHKPCWRAPLRAARHVTHGVTPRAGSEYDFLVDTDNGPVRMLAPNWETMQDWVCCLRSKLHELRILAKGENVYMSAPAPPAPRAAARDPNSPLPAPPPGPTPRVPGIELITHQQPTVQPEPEPELPQADLEPPTRIEPQNIDISSWDTEFPSIPSTSQDPIAPKDPQKSVAKICGQNICLDDSILKRNQRQGSDSDEELFADVDRSHGEDTGEGAEPSSTGNTTETNRTIDANHTVVEERPETREEKSKDKRNELKLQMFKQRVLVNDDEETRVGDNSQSAHPASNITVIQVSNKPPHTAIPVLGPETDVFDFEFKHQVVVKPSVAVKPPIKPSIDQNSNSFVNIVNTEVGVQSNDDGYGTVFSKEEPYGHISLTTTVSLTGANDPPLNKESWYERLYMASTSNVNSSPQPIRKLKSLDKNRKSSLPNLDPNQESTYEYLFPNSLIGLPPNVTTTTNITLNSNSENENSNVNITNSGNNITNITSSSSVSRNGNEMPKNNIPTAIDVRNYQSELSRPNITADVSRTNVKNEISRSKNGNEISRANITNEIPRPIVGNEIPRPNITNEIPRPNITNEIPRPSITNEISSTMESRVHVNLTSSVSVGNPDLTSRVLRANVERSHSQNAYDVAPRRDNLTTRVNSPKRDGKNEKSEPTNQKPIWRRGLTELSLLSRFRKRQDSPVRHETEDRSMTSPAKVVHRSRAEARVDGTRRRSSSLTNGQSPQTTGRLQSLVCQQASCLVAEQRRAAAAVAKLPAREARVFADYNGQVWQASGACQRWGARAGDRVCAVRGAAPAHAAHARQLAKQGHAHTVDILFHRVPLGKIYIINKRDLQSIGMKLDGECNIIHVGSDSPAARAGLPPPGRWAVTEVNNRPLNLVKGGDEEMNRMTVHGTEVSVLIQPSALVKKLRAAVKANKNIISIR